MALMQPAVVEPVTELSSSVRVRGQLPGSTITVETGLRIVAQGVATSGDQRFPLLAGVTLSRHETLYAIQHVGADHSDPPSGNQATPVGPGPATAADIGPVNIVTHPYQCGRYVYIDGVIPGANVELSTSGGVSLGSGIAYEGAAEFSLTTAIPLNGSIRAHQSAPGLGNGPDVEADIDELPDRPLLAPVITQPVRGCDASIELTGVLDGALVTIQRGSGYTETAGIPLNTAHVNLSRHLDEDDTLTVWQEVAPRCERIFDRSDPVTVGKLEPVEPPSVIAPLCAGATVVRVVGLRPGAIVHLAANQTTYDGAAAPDQTWLDCQVPGLTTDPVTATQELCGVTSAPAQPVRIDPHQEHVPPPSIVGPVFSCTGVVAVSAAHPGAMLQVFARSLAGEVAISDRVFSPRSNIVIGVTPLLIDGQSVFVRQWACSDTSADSSDEPVKPHGSPSTVTTIGPLFDGDVTVDVQGAQSGATVEVYSNQGSGHSFLGEAVADALHPVTVVGLTRALRKGEQVFAQQRVCGMLSDTRNSVLVGVPAGFGPRPFYVVAHNPNKVSEARNAVASGANGLEPDVQVYEDHPGRLCISHGKGEPSAPRLVDYLDAVHEIALENPQLALIVFDCKEEVTSPDHGFELLMAIRQHLTFDNELNVIISVAKLDYGGFFDRIIDILGPREGLMIDAEDDPGAVVNYLTNRGVSHQGYGNGISFVNILLGPYYRYTLEAACGIRASVGRPHFIYVWTANAHDEQREYIRIGVDGVITDDPEDLVTITHEAEFTGLIRTAVRADNPFRPANFTYGLHVHTREKWMAGTDANVTFTITGAAGSATKTVNTKLIKRMESGYWNWVTVPSDDLGQLQSITVRRDNSGNAPDWFLDVIEVSSARFGVRATATFNRWIDSTNPFTEPLV
jgi:PLAT/LH2 domain